MQYFFFSNFSKKYSYMQMIYVKCCMDLKDAILFPFLDKKIKTFLGCLIAYLLLEIKELNKIH